MTLIWLGFSIEGTGLGLTGWGLWRTWRANAAERDFLPPTARRAVNWVKYRLLRRARPSVTVSLDATLPRLEGAFHGTAYQAVRDDMTVEERVAIAQANAVAALHAASAATSAIDSERRKKTELDENFNDRITGAERQVTEFARSMVLDGIPTAVFGIGLASIGLFLQTLASAMGVPGN